jgi:hypothetical protein
VLAELPELEAVELWFGPGFEVPAHAHADHADLFYVLEGEAEFLAANAIAAIAAGITPARYRGRFSRPRPCSRSTR